MYLGDVIFYTKPYEHRVALDKKILRVDVTTRLRMDDRGYILDPLDMLFKCGWGNTIEDAKAHFMKRNPNVLRSQN